MPLDEIQQSPLDQDWGLNRVRWWEEKRCLFPRRCFLSKKPLWGKIAYRGVRWLHGPDEPIEEIYWLDKHEYFLWQIKRDRND